MMPRYIVKSNEIACWIYDSFTGERLEISVISKIDSLKEKARRFNERFQNR